MILAAVKGDELPRYWKAEKQASKLASRQAVRLAGRLAGSPKLALGNTESTWMTR